MAQLKDLLVSGPSRFIGDVFADNVQLNSLMAKTDKRTSTTTYGTGTNGQVLLSNGTNVYWGTPADSWSNGHLPISEGGTGVGSFGTNVTLVGNASSIKQIASANGAYYATAANGEPKFGTLPVGQGGTGKTSWTQWGVVYASATSTLTNTAAGTAGCPLIGQGSAAPVWFGGQVNTGTATDSWKTNFKGTTDATSATAAAVTFDGGVGIAKQLRVGGATTITGNTSVGGTFTSTGAASMKSTLGVDGVTTINNTTDATGATAAALVVKGGVGISKQLRVTGAVTTGSTLSVAGATTLSSTLGVSGVVTISNTTAATTDADGALRLSGGMSIKGNIIPTHNTYTLGTASYRWSKLYIGTADSYGSGTQPIYWNSGVPVASTSTVGSSTKGIYLSSGTITAMTYELKATVNSGTASQLAYYSGKNTISGSGALRFYTGNSTASTPAPYNRLHIYGATCGNTAGNMISGTAGLFSFGDGGPQITFDTSATPGGSQAGALIFTDNDTAAAGASWHFVSNQSDWNVTSKRFHARTSISIGTNLPNTSYNFYLNGTGYLNSGYFYIGSGGGVLNGAATNGGINSIRIGDDVWLGDCNAGGMMGMKSTGAKTGFYFYNSSGTNTGQLYADGTYLVINNGLRFTTNAGIYYTGSQATFQMIQFIDNATNTDGNGIVIGGGGQTIIGGGEAASTLAAQAATDGAEIMQIGNDGEVQIFSNLQDGYSTNNYKLLTWSTSGRLTAQNWNIEQETGVAAYNGTNGYDVRILINQGETPDVGLYSTKHGSWLVRQTKDGYTYYLDGYNKTPTRLAYSQSGLANTAITWLACWNGYELRAINKDQFTLAYSASNTAASASGYHDQQGARQLAAIQSIFSSHHNNRPEAIQLSTGNSCMAFGYLYDGDSYNTTSTAYGGYFIAHYNIPRYLGIAGGTWVNHRLVVGPGTGYWGSSLPSSGYSGQVFFKKV